MRQIRPYARFVAVVIALAIVFARAPRAAQAPASSPSLRHLRGIDEVKSWFNAGTGHPRLIFLLSPT